MANESNQNVTATEFWNITTLKAHLEQQIKALGEITELKFKAADDARKHQYAIDQEHFENLNNEAARILKATEVTVSRDTWDAFSKTFQEWKAATDSAMANAVSKVEFQTYKDTLTKELAVSSARTAFVNWLLAGLAASASVALIANVIWNFVKD